MYIRTTLFHLIHIGQNVYLKLMQSKLKQKKNYFIAAGFI